MKCKTMLKFLLCFLIISVLCGPYLAYAEGLSDSYFFSAGLKAQGDEYVYNDSKTQAAINAIDGNLEQVYHIQSLIMLIGVVVAVIVITVYGIQWVMATPAKRQELKAGMVPLTLGVLLLTFGPRLAIIIVNALMAAI